MPLTTSEKALVATWMRSYPSGIESSSWGYGPLEATLHFDDEWDEGEVIAPEPEDASADICREYG